MSEENTKPNLPVTALGRESLMLFSEHFADSEVKWRWLDKQKTKQIRYIEAETVMNRLDVVVGQGNWHWSYDIQPPGPNPSVYSVQGKLTIFGVTMESTGSSTMPAWPEKAAESDAMKRCGRLFGIGRYLWQEEPEDDYSRPQDGYHNDDPGPQEQSYSQRPQQPQQQPALRPAPQQGNGQINRPGQGGYQQRNGGDSPPATEPQVKAIYAIGRGTLAMSEPEVDEHCFQHFGAKPRELNRRQASEFIDLLKTDAGQGTG